MNNSYHDWFKKPQQSTTHVLWLLISGTVVAGLVIVLITLTIQQKRDNAALFEELFVYNNQLALAPATTLSSTESVTPTQHCAALAAYTELLAFLSSKLGSNARIESITVNEANLTLELAARTLQALEEAVLTVTRTRHCWRVKTMTTEPSKLTAVLEATPETAQPTDACAIIPGR
jgi:hypothetical protein